MSACASSCSTDSFGWRRSIARTAPAVRLCSPPSITGSFPASRIQSNACSTRFAISPGPSAVGSSSGSVWRPARYVAPSSSSSTSMFREAVRIACGPQRVPPWYDVLKSYGTGRIATRLESNDENSGASPAKFQGRPQMGGGFMRDGSSEGSGRGARRREGAQDAARGPKAQGPGHSAGASRGLFRRDSGGSGRRARDAPALGPDLRFRPVHVLRELRAAVEDVALDLGHPERALQVVGGELGVEGLARENVHGHVA